MYQLQTANYMAQKELSKCMQNPEGVWEWLLKKSKDFRKEAGILANRELRGFFKVSDIV